MATRYRHQKDRHAQVEELEAALAALRQAWVDPAPIADDAPPTRVWVQQQQPALAAAIERVVASWDARTIPARTVAAQRDRRHWERMVVGVLDMLALLASGLRR